MKQKKTVLFCPVNASGHINSLLGIADKLKEEYNLRTVFLVLGPPPNDVIQSHGHELVIVEEQEVHEDFEIEEGDILLGPQADDESKEGKEKKKFPGGSKIPQTLARYHDALKLDPSEAYIKMMSLFEAIVESMMVNLDNYSQALASIKPDMVIEDMFHVFPCIAGLKDIPWVRNFSCNPSVIVESKLDNKIKAPFWSGSELLTKEKREKLRKEQPEKWQAMLDRWQKTADKINKAATNYHRLIQESYKRCNLTPPEKGQISVPSPHLNLYMFPKALDYDQDDDLFEYGKRWLRYDSMIRNSTDCGSVKEWEDKLNNAMVGKQEMIYVSLGTIASGDLKLITRLLDMLKDDDKRCYIVSKGPSGDKYELPSSNMIGENYVPQTFILERCNLAIIHGGNNSVTECLYYGVPVIVMPAFCDQHDNAQRIADLGLGKKFSPYTCTKEELRKGIDEILSDKQLIEKCYEIGKEMRTRDDSRKIARTIVKLLDEGKLEESFLDECRQKEYEEIKF